jgi:hypothetical protein
MQGRVFSVIEQLGYLGASLSSYLPGRCGQCAGTMCFRTKCGHGAVTGRTGIVILVLTLAVYTLTSIRHPEAQLADYEAITTD